MLSDKVSKIIDRGNGYAHPNEGKLPAFAWPGGYPIFYVSDYGAVLCPACANETAFDDDYETVIDYDANWEDPELFCDCNKRIESAYGDDEEENT